MNNIKLVVNESRRGCGFRKPGGIYLVTDPGGFSCPALPIPMSVCPCCGEGIRAARGWTWIAPGPWIEKLDKTICNQCTIGYAGACLIHQSSSVARVGLIWVGEHYYKNPNEFLTEMVELGVSRRVPAIPQGFKIGETIVWLGHRKAAHSRCDLCDGSGVVNEMSAIQCPDCKGAGHTTAPGVFSVFRPQRIEYILTGNETDAELERLESRGVSLVKLERTDGLK